MSYEVAVPASVRRRLLELPVADLAAVLATLEALGEQPRRVGKPLRRPWEGHFVARRGPYRVIDWIDEAHERVVVARVEHRRDVYRRR